MPLEKHSIFLADLLLVCPALMTISTDIAHIDTGKITHGWIIKDGVKLDEVILLPFKAPKSYTGEDVVEIQTHGSPIIVKEILNLILDSGARMADRGEFTKRAFLNGRIDLVNAESIMNMINAENDSARRVAMKGIDGYLSNKIKNII